MAKPAPSPSRVSFGSVLFIALMATVAVVGATAAGYWFW